MEKSPERRLQITTFKAKPQFREAFAARAEKEGESLSSFIRKAIEARMAVPISAPRSTARS